MYNHIFIEDQYR